MVQAGVAVALRWAVAKWLLGPRAPFFAPVAAIIALGQSYYERGRRAVELVVAVTLGIADRRPARLPARHRASPQLALAVFIAVGLGMFFGTSQLFVNQVAVSAVLVFTITPPTGGFSFARTLDALTGGLIALAVAAVILPGEPDADPARRGAAGARRARARRSTTSPARCARATPSAAEAALVRARGIDEFGERFFDATLESRSRRRRISPARRRARDTVEFYAEAAARIDLAVRNVRVLARGAMRALALDENVPPEVADALEDLARGGRALAGALESGEGFDAVREPALRAAATATHVLEGTANLSVSRDRRPDPLDRDRPADRDRAHLRGGDRRRPRRRRRALGLRHHEHERHQRQERCQRA